MKTYLPIAFFFLSISCFSQIMPLTAEPDGGNKKASVSEQIGIVKVAITYTGDPESKVVKERSIIHALRTMVLLTKVMEQVPQLPGEQELMKIQP